MVINKVFASIKMFLHLVGLNLLKDYCTYCWNNTLIDKIILTACWKNLQSLWKWLISSSWFFSSMRNSNMQSLNKIHLSANSLRVKGKKFWKWKLLFDPRWHSFCLKQYKDTTIHYSKYRDFEFANIIFQELVKTGTNWRND